ncbi:MAG: hypothetical protein AB1324_02835 [Candidatus Micrarchaeota archaeon]
MTRCFRLLRDDAAQPLYADFRRAHVLSEGRLVSNRTAHERLIRRAEHSNFSTPLWVPFWTRTLVAYPAAGEPFGPVLRATDDSGLACVVDTRDFAGARGAALVFEDYALGSDGKAVVVEPRGAPSVIANFPQSCKSSDMFAIDMETGIPIAEKGAVAFWRTEKALIAPALRVIYGSSVPAVWLRHGMGAEFAVVVEE